jgi:WD40 repeat protein
MLSHHSGVGLRLFLLLLAVCPKHSASPAEVSFARDIAPLLAGKCATCHNKEKSKGGYEVETFQTLMRPGESKVAPIVAGHPEKSKLVELITAKNEDDRMPQKSEPLAPGQITLIEEWIRSGARLDAGESNQPLHMLIATSHPKPPEIYARPVPIRALAFSPDGTELAIGGYHEVMFWRWKENDKDAIRLERRISNVAQQIYSIAYAPNGLVAVASGTPGKLGQVNLFDTSGEGAGRVLGTARDSMLAVCFAPNGDRLAAAGADNTIRIYNIKSGQQELLIEQHADWVLGLSFNDDGALLASASRDKTARVFNTTSGELESTYVGHSAAVFAVAFLPDSKRIISAGRDKSLHLWDVREAKKSEEAKGFEGDVYRLAIGSNRVFSCSADKMIRQHSTSKKLELLQMYSGHKDTTYALSLHEPTGRLASGSFDGEVRIWDIQSGKTLVSFVATPGHTETRTARLIE